VIGLALKDGEKGEGKWVDPLRCGQSGRYFRELLHFSGCGGHQRPYFPLYLRNSTLFEQIRAPVSARP